MDLPDRDGNPTEQVVEFVEEVLTTVSQSAITKCLEATSPLEQGPKPIWIHTWTLKDALDTLDFQNLLKMSINESENVYMVSRLNLPEYTDIAMKMNWGQPFEPQNTSTVKSAK